MVPAGTRGRCIRPPAHGLRSRPWVVHLFLRCAFERDASTAPPPTRDRQERQPCDASTSATSQSPAPVRAGARAFIRRATASAIGMSVWPLRMSVRPLPARQPRRVLTVLHMRNGVSQIALPASLTALGPGGLPRLDERVLLGDGTTTTPGPENLADQSRHVKNRILSVSDHRFIRPEKSAQGPFGLFISSCDQRAGRSERYLRSSPAVSAKSCWCSRPLLRPATERPGTPATRCAVSWRINWWATAPPENRY